MERALTGPSPPEDSPEAEALDVELVYREDVRQDALGAREVEVLGSYLTDLAGELLQLTDEADKSE